MTEPKIRFAVMINGFDIEQWQIECINHVLNEDTELVLVIKGSKESLKSRLSRIRDAGLSRIFFAVYRDYISKPRALKRSRLVTDAPVLECEIRRKGKYSEYFSDEDIERIRGYEPDFILRFGFGIIRGGILNAARLGVWSFHHGDEKKYRGGPPCFWEMYLGDPVTGAILQKLTSRLDSGVILKRGFFPTILYSYGANLDQAYFDSAVWPAKVVRDIRSGVADYLEDSPSKTGAPVYRAPSPLQLCFSVFKQLFEAVRWVFSPVGHWNIGIIDAPIHSLITGSMPKINWLPLEEGCVYVADPFGVNIDGRDFLFAERYSYRDLKGGIVYSDISENSGVKFSDAFDFRFHSSYPYIFSHEGEVYCIPETCEAGEISLYRMDKPAIWIKEGTLIEDVRGVDPTVIYFSGYWWLFFTDEENGCRHNLYLWYSESLLEGWKPHGGNPVKTDIRSSRPAGTPFMHDGGLYRPAQDCSGGYGRRIVINRVMKISPVEFREEAISVIEADENYPAGRHTVSSLGERTLIDGHKMVWNRHIFRYKLKSFLKSRE